MVSFLNKYRRLFLAFGVVLMAILLAGSIYLRKDDFSHVVRAMNQEASYHVLLTVNALGEGKISNNFYLPTVSLGRESDKNISWGAALPTPTGDYIYTSFTPPGFLVPYIYFLSTNINIGIRELAYLNASIGALTALIVFCFLYSLGNLGEERAFISSVAAVFASSIGIFSRESLLSHGVNYWSHSIYQPIFALILLCLFKFISAPDDSRAYRLYLPAITILAFLLAWTEWSGYIANAGIILALIIFNNGKPIFKYLAITIFGATVLAGVTTVLHFGFALGFKAVVLNFIYRFTSRSASAGNYSELIDGYVISYGAFIIVFVLCVFLVFSKLSSRINDESKFSVPVFLIFVACFPLIENAVMLQHAAQFSFDRLKFIFPAAIIFFLALSDSGLAWPGRLTVIILLLISSVYGFTTYKKDINMYDFWIPIDNKNKAMAEDIKNITNMNCTLLASEFGVRGYANLLFHSGIHEYKKMEEAEALARNSGACAFVFLEGCGGDLPEFVKATIKYSNGSVKTITPGALQCMR